MLYEFKGEFMNGNSEDRVICSGQMHTIKEGDTLYKISRMHDVPLGELLEANRNINIYNLQVGDKICVPKKQENTVLPNNTNNMSNKWFVYIVKDDDTLDKILKDFNMDLAQFYDANSQNKVMLKPGSIVIVPQQ